MRPRWRPTVLAAAILLAASACGAPGFVEPFDDGGATPAPEAPEAPAPPAAGTPAGHAEPRAEVALCTVLPQRLVGDLVGTPAVGASGNGSHCTWELQGPSPAGEGPDLAATDAGATLQGAFLDLRAFDAGRPPATDPGGAAVAELAGVGDEAYVVRLDGGAPTTLYVRHGQRALSLWLDDVALTPEATEQSLARVASLVLRLA